MSQHSVTRTYTTYLYCENHAYKGRCEKSNRQRVWSNKFQLLKGVSLVHLACMTTKALKFQFKRRLS